jgi:hypothetical protein
VHLSDTFAGGQSGDELQRRSVLAPTTDVLRLPKQSEDRLNDNDFDRLVADLPMARLAAIQQTFSFLC